MIIKSIFFPLVCYLHHLIQSFPLLLLLWNFLDGRKMKFEQPEHLLCAVMKDEKTLIPIEYIVFTPSFSFSHSLAHFHSLVFCFPPIDFCRLYNCITSVCTCTSSLAHFYSMANDGNRCIETEISYLLLLALRNVSMLNRAPISMAITKVKKGRP